MKDFLAKREGSILPPAMKGSSETLQQYVNRIADEKKFKPPHEVIADRARKMGYKLSPGYVNNFMHGYASNPSIEILKALAAGLGEPVTDLVKVLCGEQPDDSDFRKSIFATMYEDIKRVPEGKRGTINRLLDLVRDEIRAQSKK